MRQSVVCGLVIWVLSGGWPSAAIQAEHRVKPPSDPAASAIGFYQSYISELRDGDCQFIPSCSRYAREAIEAKGLILGSALAADRLVRCNGSARHFHDRDPSGRLIDPADGPVTVRPSPQVPHWLLPDVADRPPLDVAGSRERGAGMPGELARFYADFADTLALSGDCLRATAEYKRVAFVVGTRTVRFWAQMKIGNCLYQQRDWEDAASEFLAAADVADASSDRNLAKFMGAASYFNRADYDRCSMLLDDIQADTIGVRSAPGANHRPAGEVGQGNWMLLSGLCSMALGDWQTAAAGFEHLQEAYPGNPNRMRAALMGQRAKQGSRLSSRSPTFAVILSCIVPGAGQAYCGRYRDALGHLLVNGLLGYQVYRQARDENYGAVCLLSGITYPFYVGNLLGAARSAETFNATKRAAYLCETLKQEEQEVGSTH
jgi:putative component of membrane protein insertase Oxa1/YidC/SpoIIIJ protein YidD